MYQSIISLYPARLAWGSYHQCPKHTDRETYTMYIALHIVHCAWHSVSVLDIGGSGSFALNLDNLSPIHDPYNWIYHCVKSGDQVNSHGNFSGVFSASILNLFQGGICQKCHTIEVKYVDWWIAWVAIFMSPSQHLVWDHFLCCGICQNIIKGPYNMTKKLTIGMYRHKRRANN